MNARERFAATMHYQPRDRCPIMDFGFWSETIVIWNEYGLPKDQDTGSFFGMDPQWDGTGGNTFLCPGFAHEVLEDHPDRQVTRDGDGVTKVAGKFLGTIPHYLDHTLKDRESWEREVKWRLDPANPDRIPRDLDAIAARFKDPARDYPVCIGAGSIFGRLRDLMGVEGIAMLVYDDRKLFEEMVERTTDCVIAAITPVLETGIQFEYASMWEDMCYRAGPLLTPRIFREVLVPNYQRITSTLRRYGVDVVVLDCDGDISLLVPYWLEGGVNCMFPIEVGVWGADAVAYRQQYGRDLLMIGGVSKRLLAGTLEEISAEVERLAPLVEDGGFIPTPDHRVPPDVPLRNYLYYLQEARRVWGRDLPNLRPVGQLDLSAPRANDADYVWDTVA